jgi:hypothetical protein
MARSFGIRKIVQGRRVAVELERGGASLPLGPAREAFPTLRCLDEWLRKMCYDQGFHAVG